jgi:hypothetical protein
MKERYAVVRETDLENVPEGLMTAEKQAQEAVESTGHVFLVVKVLARVKVKTSVDFERYC